tara:strand:+ start:408 stop:596 length:189 start_codon:yes stop_codon:yes gene_type:complete
MQERKYNAVHAYHAMLKLFEKHKKDEDLPEDCVRYEEHTDEEYLDHLEKFFKGKDEETKKND